MALRRAALAGFLAGALTDLDTVLRLAPGSPHARQAEEWIATLRRKGGR